MHKVQKMNMSPKPSNAPGKKKKQRIWFSVPGAKHYDSRFFKNRPLSFVNISITGRRCECKCEHCNARMLNNMIPAETPEKLKNVVDILAGQGCKGILVSGGADRKGIVPVGKFENAIGYARRKGLFVLVHSGIIEKDTALQLKESGVNQVLLDVIGHEHTIREIYHIDRRPEDYLNAMMICREANLEFVPHLVVGLHYGVILGEYTALDMIRQAGAKTMVIVILMALSGTGMKQFHFPPLSEVENIMMTARADNPHTLLNLGCAKPSGNYKRRVEQIAIDLGFDGVAFPSDATVEYAISRGLIPEFIEGCCSMAGQGFRK